MDGSLRCTKFVDGVEVVTGIAPDLKAAERHADAVGGTVYAAESNGVIHVFEDKNPSPIDADIQCPMPEQMT